MRQLTGVDSGFLYMENSRTIGHVAGVMILDPSTAPRPVNADTVREFLAARIHLLAPLRWRLVTVPLGIDRSYWIDDPDLDLEFHVRGIALPAPGSAHQLAEQVARLASRPLDRSHPLWELYVIEGLEGGRVAIMTKMHHAAVDGQASMKITTAMLDPSPEPQEIPPPPAKPTSERVPSEWEMLGRGGLGLIRHPLNGIRLVRTIAREAGGLSRPFGWGAAGLGMAKKMRPGNVPRTPFNKTISARRNFAYGSVSLTKVKKVKDEYGCTVNDVVMAICAGALRRWLVDHDALPDKPLMAMMPVSIRTAEQAAAMGNQVSAMVVALPTNLSDPGKRIEAVREETRKAKDEHNALPAHLLTDFSQFAAPAAAELIARTMARARLADRVNMPFNVCISNVPGPREPLYYAGALMLGNYPVSIVTDGMGLNITLLSYRDAIDFGIVSTPEMTPDIWNLIDYLADELDELHAVD
jgi:diacylglycerol O-acyltransferase